MLSNIFPLSPLREDWCTSIPCIRFWARVVFFTAQNVCFYRSGMFFVYYVRTAVVPVSFLLPPFEVLQKENGSRRGGERGAYSLVACVSHLTLTTHLFPDGAPFLPLIDTSNIWALITFFPYVTYKLYAYLIPLLSRRLWPSSISKDSDRFLATV